MNNFPPIFGTSYYVKNPDYNTLYSLGCAQANAAPGVDIVAVLDFGEPAYVGTTYGAYIWDAPNYTFKSTSNISQSVEGFISGFYVCSQTGTHLTVAVGVNNQGSATTNAHGVAWAQMINNLNTWIVTPPSYGSRVSARGGMDIEQTPPFGTAAATRAWVDGYSAAYRPPSLYYNFGSCDGCPYVAPCPTCQLAQDWSVNDVWYVTYGTVANYPLPDIYNSTNAAQWYQMSLYGYTNHGGSMVFWGSMTEYGACQQRDHCAGINNMPSTGYVELYNALNADPKTAQTLKWSTDINWQGEPVIYPNP